MTFMMLMTISASVLQPDRSIILMQVDGRFQAEFTQSMAVKCRDTPISVTYTSGWGGVDARIESGAIGDRALPKAVIQDFNSRVFGRRLDRLAFRDCYFEHRDGFNGVEVIVSGQPGNRDAHEPMAIVLKDR